MAKFLFGISLLIMPLAAFAEPSMLRVTCMGEDVGAEVTINGKFKGECPIDIKVAPGVLKLRAIKKVDASYERVLEQEIHIGDGVVKKVEVVLTVHLSAEGQRLEDQRLAAKKAETDTNLAESYYDGKGVEKNYEQAYKILAPLAEAGYPKAQFLLSKLYRWGNGVPSDHTKEAKWCQKAAAQQYADAQFRLGELYAEGEGVKRSYPTAIDLYQKAAVTLCCGPQINLAYLYRDGKGVPQDYAKAMEWFNKSTRSQLGCFEMAMMYYNGYGVQTDYSMSLDWWKKAAGMGSTPAMLNIGVMYEKGMGVTKDLAQAAEWYKKAAEKGYSKAQEYLDRVNAQATTN